MTYNLPPGEQFVVMTAHNGDLLVCSTTRLWVLNPEHGLVPVEIRAEAEPQRTEMSLVYEGASGES